MTITDNTCASGMQLFLLRNSIFVMPDYRAMIGIRGVTTNTIDGLILGYNSFRRRVKHSFPKAGWQNYKHISPVYECINGYHLLRLQ